MKKLTITILTSTLSFGAFAGGNHFHATCAFGKDGCGAVKTNEELKGALGTAVDLLKLDAEWKKATIQGDVVPFKDDVVQFKAKHPTSDEVKLFSFRKNGVLLGAKSVK